MWAFSEKLVSRQRRNEKPSSSIAPLRAHTRQSEQAQIPPQHQNSELSAARRNPGFNFSRIRVHSAQPVIQKKLPINAPGDGYEQEADRVSQLVMQMPGPQLQRVCACGGTCSDCQKKTATAPLQMKAVRPSSPAQSEAPPIVHDVLRSPGQPLDSSTRAFMKPRFGWDFSRVRVHSDPAAQQSAREVNARAYTVGSNIVFAQNQFSPSSNPGRTLLAHELTHIVQQDKGATAIQRQLDQSDDEPSPATVPRSLSLMLDPSTLCGPGKCLTDEELEVLPQAGSVERADQMIEERKAEAKEQKRVERIAQRMSEDELNQRIEEMRARLRTLPVDQQAGEQKRLERWEKGRARRHSLPIAPPENTDGAIRLMREAWVSAEKQDPPDLTRAYHLVYRVRQWIMRVGDLDGQQLIKGFQLTIAQQTLGPTKTTIDGIFRRLRDFIGSSGKAGLRGHWELAINGLGISRDILEVLAKHQKLESTSFYATAETLRKAGMMTPALIGGAAVAPGLVAAGIEAVPALTEAVPYAARAMYLNAPAIYGSALAYGGAVATGLALGQHLLQIRKEGLHPSDIPQLAGDLVPFISGYLEAQSFSLSRGTPGGGNAEPAEPDLVVTYSRQQGSRVIAGITVVRSGRQYDGEIDPMSGDGQIVDRASRQVIGIIRNGQIMQPSSRLIGAGTSAPAGSPATAPPQAGLPGRSQMPQSLPAPVPTTATSGPKSALPATTKNLPTPPYSPPSVNAPPRGATLPIRSYGGQKFKSVYPTRPTWIDPEKDVERALNAMTPGWIRKPRFQTRPGVNLLSTVPELYHPKLAAVEVKNVALSELGRFYSGWAEQLARRNLAISSNVPGPIKNWLFVDVRGSNVEIDLPARANLIQTGVSAAGRIANQPGPTFDKVFFILDREIVETP